MGWGAALKVAYNVASTTAKAVYNTYKAVNYVLDKVAEAAVATKDAVVAGAIATKDAVVAGAMAPKGAAAQARCIVEGIDVQQLVGSIIDMRRKRGLGVIRYHVISSSDRTGTAEVDGDNGTSSIDIGNLATFIEGDSDAASARRFKQKLLPLGGGKAESVLAPFRLRVTVALDNDRPRRVGW